MQPPPVRPKPDGRTEGCQDAKVLSPAEQNAPRHSSGGIVAVRGILSRVRGRIDCFGEISHIVRLRARNVDLLFFPGNWASDFASVRL